MNRFVDNIYRFSSCYRLCSINIIRLLNMHNISSQMAHMGLNNVLQVKLITYWNVTNPICWQIHPYDTIKNDLSRQNLGIVEIGISFGLLKGAQPTYNGWFDAIDRNQKIESFGSETNTF